MIESLMPSEVARLVLGYLKEKECIRTIGAFLAECPDLKEYSECLKRGREHSTRICGKSLLDILNEYCATTNLADAGSTEMKQLVRAMESSMGQCKSMLNFCHKNHGRDRDPRVNLQSVAQRTSSRISLTVARQSQEKQNPDSSTNFVPVPIILNTNRQTMLERAFGSRTVEPRTESPKATAVEPTIPNLVSELPPNGESTEKDTGHSPSVPEENLNLEERPNLPLNTPIKLRLLNESVSKSPKRKSNTPRKRNCNTPLVKSSTSAAPDDERATCQNGEENMDLNAMLEELLSNTTLHERIAENINRVVSTCEAVEPNRRGEHTVEVNAPQLQESAVPSDVIKDIIDRTECDPAFETFLNLITGVKQDCGSGDVTSTPSSLLSEAMSNLETECSNACSFCLDTEISSVEATPIKPPPKDTVLETPAAIPSKDTALETPAKEPETPTTVIEAEPKVTQVENVLPQPDPPEVPEVLRVPGPGKESEKVQLTESVGRRRVELTTLTPMEYTDSVPPVIHIPEVPGLSMKNLGINFGLDPSFLASTVFVLSNSASQEAAVTDAADRPVVHQVPKIVTLPPGSVFSFTNLANKASNVPLVSNPVPVVTQELNKANIRLRTLKRQRVGDSNERPVVKKPSLVNSRKVVARSLDVVQTAANVKPAAEASNKQSHIRMLDFATPRKDIEVPAKTNSAPTFIKLSVPSVSVSSQRKPVKPTGGKCVNNNRKIAPSSKKTKTVDPARGKASDDKEVAEMLVSMASGIHPASAEGSSKEKLPKRRPSCPAGAVRKPTGKTKSILSEMDVDKFLSKLHYVE